MMQIVEFRILAKDALEDIQAEHIARSKARPAISTMIIHCLAGAADEEHDAHACCQIGEGESEGGAEDVEEECFDGVSVESGECVGDVDLVVPAVEMTVEEVVRVKEAVKPVLPGFHDEAGFED